jgi:hypothetical protein
VSARTLNYQVCEADHDYDHDGTEVVKFVWVPVAYCTDDDSAQRVACGLSAMEKTRFYVRLSDNHPYVSYYQTNERTEP